ncbi:hypothetical protein OG241_27090 [Streptomyces sp. NBC_01390]|uniref:hypothetical protein n=1 Tax=Streptomyces sp. NBC_01390 TaxID=2903850 RepID=UPI00324537F6
MSTLSLPMKLFVDVPLVAAGDPDGDVGVLLGAWLAGELALGVGVLPEPPGFPVLPTLPASTSFHCWLAAARSRFWTMSRPLALAALLNRQPCR